MTSLWIRTASAKPIAAPLRGSLRADVAVIGGGITGVATALRLAEAGKLVALLEAGDIGAADTGRSTGNLYGTVSSGLRRIVRKWDADVARRVVDLRLAAVSAIEADVQAHGIDCDFVRAPQHIGLEQSGAQALADLKEEFDACSAAGLAPAWMQSGTPLPFPDHAMLVMQHQAQFNPYAYATGLANVAAGQGVRMFTATRVTDVDASAGLVRTADGEVHADAIVMASHSPVGFNLVQAEMQPVLEYGVAAPVETARLPDGIFWLQDESHSLRTYRHEGRDYLVVVGEPHPTGEPGEGAAHLERLRHWAKAHFKVDTFSDGWSAQQFKPADGLPYIGRSAHDNVYIATGFGADGLAWGVVAARLITDVILGRDAADEGLLTPRRFTPVKSAKSWAQENATVVKHLVGARLRDADTDLLAAVAPGEGRIVEIDGDKCAVYRSPDGALSTMSPVCPHLKCLVTWNGDAPGWDCPCHGSRFDPTGRLLDGPATEDLAPIVLGG